MERMWVKSTTMIVTLLALLFSQPLYAAEQKALTYAVIQDSRMSVLAKRSEPLLKYLSEKLGVKIAFYATTSYASVVEAMLGGFVDFARLGPKIYLVAAEKSNGKLMPIANGARTSHIFNPEPCACYHGLLITKTGSKYNSIKSLKGSVLALVDPGSTSGNVAPRALFTEEIGGSELESYFGRIFYSGSHDASVLSVVNGKADAAFVADSTAARLVSRGEAKKEDINVLWRTPQIAMDPIVVNSRTMSQTLIGKLKDAYMGMNESAEGKAILKLLKAVKFMPATDATYDPVRKIVAAKAEMAKKKAKKN